MGFIADIFSRIRVSSGLPMILFGVAFYFGYFALYGDKGYIRYSYLTEEVAKARQTGQKYAKEKADWNERVKLLSSESLDLDMLDERARVVLNMVGPQELVILDDMTAEE